MERSPTKKRAEERRGSYRVERKFNGTRTAAELVESLVRAHS